MLGSMGREWGTLQEEEMACDRGSSLWLGDNAERNLERRSRPLARSFGPQLGKRGEREGFVLGETGVT